MGKLRATRVAGSYTATATFGWLFPLEIHLTGTHRKALQEALQRVTDAELLARTTRELLEAILSQQP